MPHLIRAGVFLIQTVFGALVVLFLLRALLIATNMPFSEPLCRFVYTLTNRVVTPLRTLVPRWRKLEFASLLVAWLLCVAENALLYALVGMNLDIGMLLARALVDLLDWTIWIELIAIFGYCLLSFFPAVRYDDNFMTLSRFVTPVVRPFRRLLPPIGGLDFSCWLASVALILAQLLVVAPLYEFTGKLS